MAESESILDWIGVTEEEMQQAIVDERQQQADDTVSEKEQARQRLRAKLRQQSSSRRKLPPGQARAANGRKGNIRKLLENSGLTEEQQAEIMQAIGSGQLKHPDQLKTLLQKMQTIIKDLPGGADALRGVADDPEGLVAATEQMKSMGLDDNVPDLVNAEVVQNALASVANGEAPEAIVDGLSATEQSKV